jgi:hypothetical protein
MAARRHNPGMPTKKKSLKRNPAVQKRELERWKKRGKALKAAEDRLRSTEFNHQWRIADWMLAGVKAFKQEVAYKEASAVTGMTVETLRQFVHTARNVLIRVNGLSFGHHRLVAKFRHNRERQKKELLHAKNNNLSVEKFDLYLKGVDRADETESNTPTNADAAAARFIRRCDDLLEKESLGELLRCDPPEPKLRGALVEKLEETAEEFNRAAEELKERWTMYDPQAVAIGFRRKEDYEEFQRRRDITLNKSAATAAGGGR